MFLVFNRTFLTSFEVGKSRILKKYSGSFFNCLRKIFAYFCGLKGGSASFNLLVYKNIRKQNRAKFTVLNTNKHKDCELCRNEINFEIRHAFIQTKPFAISPCSTILNSKRMNAVTAADFFN